MERGITTILPLFLRQPRADDVSCLARAVESVLSQPCEVPLELLVIDDGSEPPALSVREVQRVLQRPRVRVLRLLRNRGVACALNCGLIQARYDLIARIDADDVWRKEKLETQLRMLAADPDLTLIASSMRLVHPADPQFDRDELRGGGWEHALALTERIGCPFPHGSILARRVVFEQLGGYPQDAVFQHAEDFALWAQWMRFFKVAICSEVFLEYTVGDDQISARYEREQQQATTAARRILDVLPDRARVPHAIARLAASLGVDGLTASSIFFTVWKYYDHILVEPGQYEAAVTIFPDRAVHTCEQIDTLLADRFFYLHRGPFDRGRLPPARVIHTADDILSRVTSPRESSPDPSR